MAMSKEANVLNLSYLTERGGTKLVRALFQLQFTDMKPDNEDPGTWTVDKFLKINMVKNRPLHLNRRSMQILYPAEGTKTNLDFWDLSLFVIILKTTCHLSTDMKMKLSALKKLRDKLAHIGDSDITDTKYKSCLDKIHNIFETVLKELKDEELEKTVRDMFQKIENGVIPYTELLSAFQKLLLSYEDIKKSEEETRNTVRAEHSETRIKIEKGETNILNAIKNLEQRIASTDTREIYSRKSTIVPVKMKPLNGTVEVDESLTQALVEMFNEEILPTPERHDHSIHRKTLRDAVHKFFITLRGKGYEIVKAESGCILLHAKFSLMKMFSFYTDFISGELDVYVDDIEKASKEFLNIEEFRLEMILFEDDFCRVLHEIEKAAQVGNLSPEQDYSGGQHHDTDGKELYVQDGGSTSVLLTFKPLSHFDGKEFENVLVPEAKRLIEIVTLPHDASISKSKISEGKEITKPEDDYFISSVDKELFTLEASPMKHFDEEFTDLERQKEAVFWTKAMLAVKIAKVSVSGYITKTFKDFLLNWTTDELEHLSHFFSAVDSDSIYYEQREWKMKSACKICQVVFTKVLAMHHNSSSPKLIWNPKNKPSKYIGCTLIKSKHFNGRCNICDGEQCIFYAERQGVDLQEKESNYQDQNKGHTQNALDSIDLYFWRIGNMFMFHDGEETPLMKNTSPADTDPVLVFKMMKNCKLFMQTDVPYDEVLEVIRYLMHTSNQRIPQVDFDNCIEVLIKFMTEFEGECSVCLLGKREMEQLVASLEQLSIDEIKYIEQMFKIQNKQKAYDISISGRFGKSQYVFQGILTVYESKSKTENATWITSTDSYFRAENEQLRQSLGDLRNENDELRQMNSTDSYLRADNAQLRQIIGDLRKENEELRQTCAKGDTTNESLKQQISDLQKEIETIRKEKITSTDSYFRAENEQLRQSLGDLQNENEELRQTCAEGDTTNESLKQQISDLQKEIETIRKEKITSTDSYFRAEKEQLRQSTGDLRNENEELRQTCAERDITNERLKQQISDLQKEIETVRKEKITSTDSYFRAENEQLRQSLGDLRNENEELLQSNFKKRKVYETLRGQMYGLQTESEEIQRKTTSDARDLKPEILKQQISHLKKELEIMRKENFTSIFEKDSLRLENERLKRRMYDLQTENREIRRTTNPETDATYIRGTEAYMGASIGTVAGAPGMIVGGLIGGVLGGIGGLFNAKK